MIYNAERLVFLAFGLCMEL